MQMDFLGVAALISALVAAGNLVNSLLSGQQALRRSEKLLTLHGQLDDSEGKEKVRLALAICSESILQNEITARQLPLTISTYSGLLIGVYVLSEVYLTHPNDYSGQPLLGIVGVILVIAGIVGYIVRFREDTRLRKK